MLLHPGSTPAGAAGGESMDEFARSAQDGWISSDHPTLSWPALGWLADPGPTL